MRFAGLHFTVLGAIMLLAATFAPTAHAGTTYYWYGTDTTLGGDGTWDTALAYWSASTSSYSAVAWSNTTGYDAYFGGASSGSVTLSDNITVGSLTLATAGYNFSGGTLNLGGGISASYSGGGTINSAVRLLGEQNWSIGSGSGLTVTGAVSGSGSINRTGNGALILSGTNTYTGGTTLWDGWTVAGNTASFGGTAGGVLTLAGGTLSSGFGTARPSALIPNSVYVKEGTNTVLFTGSCTYVSGTNALGLGGNLTGSGTLTHIGSACSVASNGQYFYLYGNNSGFTGTVLLASSDGSVLNRQGVLFGSLDSGSANATWVLDGNKSTMKGAVTVGSTSGTISLGALSGTSTDSYVNNINAGTIAYRIGDLGKSTTFAGRILDYSTSGTNSIECVLLQKVGSGTLTLTGFNMYGGTNSSAIDTIIDGGTLLVGNGGTNGVLSRGTNSTLVNNVANNSYLAFNRSDAYTFGGVISGTGSVSQVGAGTLTLSQTNTYTGVTTVAAGTLRVTGTIAASSGVSVNAGSLFLAGGIAPSVSVSGSATLAGYGAAGSVSLASGGILGSSGDSSTWGRQLTVAGLSLAGGNCLNFGNVNSYTSSGTTALWVTLTNGFTCSGGTINLYGTGPTGTQDAYLIRFLSSGSLSLGSLGLTLGTYAVGTSPMSCALQLTGGGGSDYYLIAHYTGGEPRSLYWTALGNTTWNTLTQSPHNWALVANDSATDYAEGDTVLFDDRVGVTSATVTLGQNVNPASVTFNNGSTVSYMIAGIGYGIGGTTSLVLNGAGTVTLLTNNTYGGSTTINAGVLQLGNGGATGSIAGNVFVGSAGTLAFNRSNACTYSQAISGSGLVANVGAGTVTLSGVSSYSGTAVVAAGALRLTGSLANASVWTGSSATLVMAGGTAGSVYVAGGALTGYGTAGSIIVASGGVVGSSTENGTWGGTLSTANLTLLGHATLNLGNVSAYTSTAAITVNNSFTTIGTLTVNLWGTFSPSSSGTLHVGRYDGAISGFFYCQLGTVSFATPRSTYTVGTATDGMHNYLNVNYYIDSLYWTGLGNCVWSTATQSPKSWALASDDSATDYLEGDAVLFDDRVGVSSATVTLGMNVNPGAVTFNNSSSVSYTIAGSGYGISGTTSLTKNGAGTVTLLTDNAYTGATTINAGTLQLGNGSATGSLVGNVVDNATLIFNRSDAYTYSGIVSGAGFLSVAGGGTLSLTGANTFGGTTTINAGNALQIGNGGAGGALGGTIVNSGTLAFNRSNSYTFAYSISGTGSVAKLGAGALNLSGANVQAGSITILGGTLSVAGGSVNVADTLMLWNTSGIANALNLSSGTINVAGAFEVGGNSSGTCNVNVTGGLLNVTNGSQTGTINVNSGGVLTLNGGAVTADVLNVDTTGQFINQAGTFTLAGASSITTGTLSVSGGVTAAASNLTVGEQAGSAGYVEVNNGGTLEVLNGVLGIGNDGTLQGGSGSGSLTVSNGTLNANVILLGSAVGGSGSMVVQSYGRVRANYISVNDLTIGTDSEVTVVTDTSAGTERSGEINVNDGTLTSANIYLGLTSGCTGTMTITGGAVIANNVFLGGTASAGGGTGIVTITGGSLTATETLQIWSNTSSVTVSNGGRVIAGALIGSAGTLAISDPGGGVALTVGSAGSGSFAGAITDGPAGPGSLLKIGGGTQTLSGNLSYTGTTTVNGGALEVQNHALVSSAISVSAGAVLLYNTSSDITQGTTSLGGGGTLMKSGTGRLTFGATEGTITWALTSGAMIDVQGGSLTLGAVDHKEDWTANLASLNIAANAVCVTTAANISVDVVTGSGTLSGGYPDYGYVEATIGVNNGSGTFSGVIQDDLGPLNLVKTGSGTQVFAGSNTYTGTTTVSGGILVGAKPASLPGCNAFGSITVASGAAAGGYVAASGYWTEADLATLRTHANWTAGAALAIDTTPGSYTYTSALTDGGIAGTISIGLVKLGAGNLTLSVANTYTGLTTVLAGSLTYGVDNAISTGGVTVNGGTLNLGSFSDSLGAVSLAGGAIIGSGTLTSASGFTVSSGLVSVVLAGSVGLTKSGSGTVTLTRTNAYTGGTTINAGVLQIGTGSAAGSITGNVLNNGALALNRSDAYTFGYLISGTGSVSKLGSGTLTLPAANSYTGTTTVDAGVLVLQGTASINAALAHTKANISAGTLVFDYSSTPGSGAGIASQINSILSASYNGEVNSWASGTIYSTLANTHSADSYALGWTNNTATSAVTVKVVLYGDATFDGTVNIYDLGQVLANYNASGVWATGDFNYDGTVNIYDLGQVLANYNRSLSLSGVSVNPADYSGLDGDGVAALQAAGVNVVSEPGAPALLTAGLVGLVAYLWRKRKERPLGTRI
jgi:fibronectin-binding autotransporter adhesin